jgi:hypothetical protein
LGLVRLNASMTFTAAGVGVAISLAAFVIALYGVFERGAAAKRAERLRLTSIVEGIAKLRRELVESAASGTIIGDSIEVLSAQLELLAQQAWSLVTSHELDITSTEYREIASAFEQVRFVDLADEMWQLALKLGAEEGEAQKLYASRGYAYFLFRNERADAARQLLEVALSEHVCNTDGDRVAHAETLRHWLVWEMSTHDNEPQVAMSFKRRIDDIVESCITRRGKEIASQYAIQISIEPARDGPNSPPGGPSPS